MPLKKEIHSLAEYIDEICKLNRSFVKNGANLNEIMLFRGQADVKYDLMPSLGRDRELDVDISIFNEERDMIDMAKYKLPDVFHNDLQPIELLALLQHHGIPTRLLDITENALVALYFACVGSQDADGEVIIFKHNERSVTNYPVVNAIADSYRFSKGTLCPLSLFYGDVITQPYFLEQKQMNKICNETPEAGGRWIAECCQSPFFVYAPIRSFRQQIQRGRYILFPNRIEQYTDNEQAFATIIDPMPKDHECIAGVFTIPKAIKHSVLYNLKLFGISKEILFGDNIDTVCEGIKNMFEDKVKGNLNELL